MFSIKIDNKKLVIKRRRKRKHMPTQVHKSKKCQKKAERKAVKEALKLLKDAQNVDLQEE